MADLLHKSGTNMQYCATLYQTLTPAPDWAQVVPYSNLSV